MDILLAVFREREGGGSRKRTYLFKRLLFRLYESHFSGEGDPLSLQIRVRVKWHVVILYNDFWLSGANVFFEICDWLFLI